MMLTVPQLLMFTGTGAMKSFNSAPKDDDARLLIMALPNALHVPDGNTPAAVRLMAASPNSFGARLTGADGSRTESLTVVELTEPSATLPPRITWFPQQGRLLLATHWLVAPVVVHVARGAVQGGGTLGRGGQRLGFLVDLEVDVGRARRVGPLPGQVEEVAVVDELGAAVEAGQVTLVGWDRTRDEGHVRVVRLGALAEGGVRCWDGLPQGLEACGIVAGQLRREIAVDGEVGCWSVPVRLGGFDGEIAVRGVKGGARQVDLCGSRLSCRGRRGNRDADDEHCGGCQHAPRSPGQMKSGTHVPLPGKTAERQGGPSVPALC